MHEARLSLLASKHAPERDVVAYSRDGKGNYLTLSCGHSIIHAHHFDSSKTTSCRCRECGRDLVKTLPQYQSEF